jgi:hypothetical protein
MADWLVKDLEAWDWLCGWWTSKEFRVISEWNRLRKSSVHRYGVDRHIRETHRMVQYSFIIVNFVLPKASTGADPHYLDVCQHAHQGNADVAEKMVSISFYSYASFVISVLNSIFCMIDI